MTKAAYIRNSLLWASSSLPEGESLNIMVASVATGRKAWHGNCSWELTYWSRSRKQRASREQLGLLKPQSTPQGTHLPPTRPHFLIIPKQHHQLWTKPSNGWAYRANSCSNHANHKYLNRTFILSYQSFCTVGEKTNKLFYYQCFL